jgi:hypothetical protein
MPISEKRFHVLESGLGDIVQRVSNLEGHKEATATHKPTNTALIALLSLLGTAVLAYCGWLGIQVVKQGNQISQILIFLSPDLIKAAASQPTDAQSAKQVVQIVKQARKSGKQIDSGVVTEAGVKFVEAASNTTPGAWAAATELIDYKSFLDNSLRDVPVTDAATPNFITHYFYRGVGP